MSLEAFHTVICSAVVYKSWKLSEFDSFGEIIQKMSPECKIIYVFFIFVDITLVKR